MRRTANATRRRAGTSGSPSFVSLTNWARPITLAQALADPSWTTVPFTTSAGLTTALNNITGTSAKVYIYYNGTGGSPLVINTTTAANAYTISGKNPAGQVVVDLGTARSTWGSSTTTNYVKFTQNHTSTNGESALSILASSNLALYGGEFTSTAIGISMRGAITTVSLFDTWIHDVGMHGILAIPSTSSGGTSTITGTRIQAEVGPNWCMNPALDPHPDKGSGIHCAILFDSGNGSSFTNNTLAIYGHDSLTAGATSYGQTWPEGGGGSCMELGQTSGGSGANNTLYAKGVNFHMIPNSTNPGSTGTRQFGGRLIALWGNVALTGLRMGWLEANNITGPMVGGDGGNWHPTAIVVDHGRATLTNQSTVGSNAAPQNVPYPVWSNVTYNDCT